MKATVAGAAVGAQVLATTVLGVVVPGFYGRSDYGYVSNPADDGTVILTRDNGQAARWIPGQSTVPLTFFGGFTTHLAANGSRLAGVNSSNLSFIFDLPNGPMQPIPIAPGSQVLDSRERGISASGNVVVGSDSDVGAWKWTPQGGTQLLMPGFGGSIAHAVSRNGITTVGTTGTQPMVHTDATGAQAIPLPAGAPRGEFRGVSGDGSVAVGGVSFVSTNQFPAVRWSQANGYQLLPTLPDLPNTSDQVFQAFGANQDGTIIVGTQSVHRAWIWDAAHGTRDLRDMLVSDFGYNLTNWALDSAFYISPDGTIISGQGRLGFTEACWVAVIPAPGSAVTLLTGAWLLRRRHRRN